MAAAIQGGGAAGYGGDSLGAILIIQCSIVRCGRRVAVGVVDRVMCVGS